MERAWDGEGSFCLILGEGKWCVFEVNVWDARKSWIREAVLVTSTNIEQQQTHSKKTHRLTTAHATKVD